jgi:hypothetical protein
VLRASAHRFGQPRASALNHEPAPLAIVSAVWQPKTPTPVVATFIARRQHIHKQPLEFYKKSLAVILQMDIPARVTGGWEYSWYQISSMQDQPIAVIQDYLRTDGLEWPPDKHLDGLLTVRPIIL